MDLARLHRAGARIGARISGLGCRKAKSASRQGRDFLLSVSARLLACCSGRFFCDSGWGDFNQYLKGSNCTHATPHKAPPPETLRIPS